MLDSLNRLAIKLLPWRWVTLALAALSLVAFLVSLAVQDGLAWWLLMPGLLLLIWSLYFFSWISLFALMPQAADAHQAWHRRLINRVIRFGYGLLALLYLGLFAALLMMTLRGSLILA